MKTRIHIKKRYIIIGSIALLLFLILFFLSSIVCWYLVKNSEKLIGRKIALSELHINYLNCSVSAENFVMFEKNKQDTFVSFRELYVNFDPWNLLHHEYAFSEIRLMNPTVSLIYADTLFNFSDLMQSGDSTKKDTVKNNEGDTVRFLVRNIKLAGGYIRYEDKNSKTITELKELGVAVPEISWNSRQSKLGIDFTLGTGGKVSLGGNINQAAGNYTATIKTENIDISPYTGYIKPFLDVALVGGKLNTDIRIAGEMSDPMKMKVFGEAGLSDFLINDKKSELFCKAKNITVKLDSLDIAHSNFCIHKVELNQLKLVATLEKNNSNIQRLLAPLMVTDTAAAKKETTAADTTTLHYSIDSLIMKACDVAFTDLTLRRPFRYDINNIDLAMADFSDKATAVPLTYSMSLNKSGSFSGKATLNMVNTFNIIFDGAFANMDLVSLSPYTEYYLARPIKKGTFNYKCKLSMNDIKLDNLNNIKIVNLEFGKKIKDSSVYKVPVCLALYIIKDRNGLVKVDLPISGKPSDPNFKLRKIIWKTVEEFLIKVCLEPFKAIGDMFGTNPENIKQIPFDYLQDSLTVDQKTKLDKISEILTKKNELSFTFAQTTDPDKEKGMLALSRAKYLFVSKTMPQGTDTREITRAASTIKDMDPAFLTFIGMEGDSLKGNLTNRCMQLAGSEFVENKFAQLLVTRQSLLNNYFSSKGLPPGSVAFKNTDLRNLPDELKTPKFMVEVTVK